MLRKRTKKDYLVPRSAVTEVDLEGIICQSDLMMKIQVDEIKNINSLGGSETGGKSEPLYFEF